MRKTKLRIIVCLAISLFMLLAVPCLTSLTIDSAYALGRRPPLPPPGDDGGDDGGGRHGAAPEPATWLLIGSGLGGVALYRKIRKK